MAAVEFASTSLFSDANLVSYYKLENVNDSKGTNTLTNNGTVAFNAGLFNNAADFGDPNSTKYLSGNYTYVTSGTDFSVGWWHKAPTASNNYISFKSDAGGGGADEYYMGVSPTGGLDFHSCNSDGSEADMGGTFASFDYTQWNHVVFTVTKNGSDYDKKIYTNGSLANTATVTGKTSGKLGEINIARFIYETSIVMDGLCDDMVIFNRALTLAEVQIIYGSSSIKTVNGLAKASVKTVNGLAIASVKNWNGLA